MSSDELEGKAGFAARARVAVLRAELSGYGKTILVWKRYIGLMVPGGDDARVEH